MSDTSPSTQLRFNMSQVVQLVVYAVLLALAWANLAGKMDIIALKQNGVYTKQEIDQKIYDINKKIDDNARQVRRVNAHLGITDE